MGPQVSCDDITAQIDPLGAPQNPMEKMKVLNPQYMGEIIPKNEGNVGSHGITTCEIKFKFKSGKPPTNMQRKMATVAFPGVHS